MNNHLTCVICHGSYNLDTNIPKVLHCGHTHCIVCIKQIDVEEGYIRCPLCNKSEKHSDNYPTNFALVQILEQHKTESGGCSFRCVECEALGKAQDQHICVTCTQNKHGLIIVADEIDQVPGGVDSLILCPACVIRNHCKRRHETMELSELKLDLEFLGNMRDVKKLHESVKADEKKFASKMQETRKLMTICERDCENVVRHIQDAKTHRNYPLAMPSLMKSFEVLRNTYSYCTIKLAEVNARLIAAFPREPLTLIEKRPEDHYPPTVQLEPITEAMKFRAPKMFPIDQNVLATGEEPEEGARSPTPELTHYEIDDQFEGDMARLTEFIPNPGNGRLYGDTEEAHFPSYLLGSTSHWPLSSIVRTQQATSNSGTEATNTAYYAQAYIDSLTMGQLASSSERTGPERRVFRRNEITSRLDPY